MSITIKIPPKLTYYNIQRIIFNIDKLDDENSVLFDLSELDYVDPEGLNYIALMPFYLDKILLKKITIRLPQIDDTISYLHFTGLLQNYFNNFKVEYYNCVEDVMFLKKTYPRSNFQKARLGIVTKKTFQSFLSNELSNVEKLIASSEVSRHFCFCFYELIKNIFDHSGETIGGFSFHYQTNRETLLTLSIADIGKGIKSSLANQFNCKEEIEDYVYIREAIKEGVSSTGKLGRGLGLYRIINTIDDVQITSGNGQIITHEGKVYQQQAINTNLRGTSIYLKIRL